jgi:hypothetical protein
VPKFDAVNYAGVCVPLRHPRRRGSSTAVNAYVGTAAGDISEGKPVSGEKMLNSAAISIGVSFLGSGVTSLVGGFKAAAQRGEFARFRSYPPNHPAGMLSAVADTTQSAQASVAPGIAQAAAAQLPKLFDVAGAVFDKEVNKDEEDE